MSAPRDRGRISGADAAPVDGKRIGNGSAGEFAKGREQIDDIDEDLYVGRATTPQEIDALLGTGRACAAKLRALASGR